MDAAGWVLLGLIVAAVLALIALARRRAWNADGSDDERRRRDGQT